MNVREIIRAFLIEAGKSEQVEKLYVELEDNEFANTEVGADVDSGPIRYVESINNEFPTFVGLDCERI